MVRTSERSSFKRCRWQWARGYIDRLEPVRDRPALRFGTLVHKAMELRYPPGIKRGPKPAETFEKLYQKQLEEEETAFGFRLDEDDQWSSALEIGVDLLEMYIERYGRDEDWQVIASEQTFKVPVYARPEPDHTTMAVCRKEDEGAKLLFYYVGTMDGVWKSRMDGKIRVIDWKTTSTDPTKLSHLVLDEQATAYWTWGVDYLIAKKILKPRQVESLDGMLYTFMRKARRDPRPTNAQGQYLNKDGSVSKVQPSPIFHRELVYRGEPDRQRARQRVVEEFLEMKGCRSGDMAIYKTPGGAVNSHCNWCAFRDVCELHELDADWEGLRDATMKPWDPYSAHEIAEEGKR